MTIGGECWVGVEKFNAGEVSDPRKDMVVDWKQEGESQNDFFLRTSRETI